MAAFPTKLAEAFASQSLEIFYATSITDEITNSEYEGQIKDKSSTLNVLTFGAITEHTYNGSDMTADTLTESNCQLVTNQLKYIYFNIKDYDTFRSYIKNPESTIQKQVASRMKLVIDTFVLTFYTDAKADIIGTDFSTGTIEVAVTTGEVTHSATGFLATMVGKLFKAVGHSEYYRIITYTDTNTIWIADDLDDVASQYTGGAIAGSTAFVIRGLTSVQVTSSTIFGKITDMATALNNQAIPQNDRFLVLPSTIAGVLKQSVQYVGTGAGSEAAINNALNGRLPGIFAGFKIFEVPDSYVAGNATDGWHCLGGHKSAICFAMGLTENGIEDAYKNFGKNYKSLYVYGAKVPDERRKALVEGYFKL
jgi:hypothetical protein